MKVLILGGPNSRNTGGIFNIARMLGMSLGEMTNSEVHFLMYDDEFSFEDRKLYDPIPLHSYSLKWPKSFGYSNDLANLMKKINPEIIHTQGIWMYLSYANRKYNRKTGTPYVISTHGMLDSWQLHQTFFKDAKKRIVLKLFEMEHLQNANCIHANSLQEFESIRKIGLRTPVAIIPNGINLPAINSMVLPHSHSFKNKYPKDSKILLFLSRIHFKKGLDILLEGWSLTNPNIHGWKLVIAGDSKDVRYKQSLLDKTTNLDLNNSVSFIGGQFGKDKENCYLNANAFILPSYSEGMPVAVLEAWSYKIPVLMTENCNLGEGFENQAAIKIDASTEGVKEGINTLISLNESERLRIGQNGFELVKSKFTWNKIAVCYMNLYKWMRGENIKPDFVLY
jgi:glycosyltransferase involved in cell wall biosynthesis